jgi:toxin-antitoxin system PIN domain toxin
MISFFPDLNVWLALSVAAHAHNTEVWNWMGTLSKDVRLIFSRYTQVGLLRLLTNSSVMGEQTLTLKKAWDVYDQWLSDPRIEYYPEPRGLEAAFREATAPFGAKPASKWVGDCYLLACSRQSGATLLTFDRALLETARKHGYAAIIPA